FYASVRIDIRRIQAIKRKDEVVGNRTRIKITKNKVAPPFRQAEIDLMYDHGFSMESDILDLGVEADIIEKRGAFYRYNDGLIGQGRENAKEYLRDNPGLAEELEMLIRESYEIMPLNVYDDEDEELVEVED
ncbi:MAG: DNA recombination/repair protein RecA, partial [Chloroflexi bacterium]|nr:DNA recombination/repair protein RecA [Chloroflexota bacterium]